MLIGVPKEIKNNENRVAIVPAGVQELIKAGHEIWIEDNAGLGSGITNHEYEAVGAKIVKETKKVWEAEMVLKVKEPLASEYQYFRENLILFTYLHLAANEKLTKALVENKVIAIAYETVEDHHLTPLLRPMSEVAGRRSVVIGATFLEKHRGGKGILLSGIPGTDKANVTIVGGGIAGLSAAKMALGLGANVTILEIDEERLRFLENTFGSQISVLKSNDHNLETTIAKSDLLISSILVPGAKAPKIITEKMVKSMSKGSVIVDIAIDQGGSVETIDRVTTHDDPIFEKYGVLHYTVANIPGAVPRTATFGLTNASLPFVKKIANLGWMKACAEDSRLALGLNVLKGSVTNVLIAKALNQKSVSWKTLI